MADISITLTLDDTQYTANLKKIDTNTQAFGTNTKKTMTESTNAVNMFTESLKKSGEQITGMGEKFKTLNDGAKSLVEGLVGLSVIEFGKKLLEGAENTVHLANAFGMTVEKTMELQAAFARAGIDSDKAGQALSKMAQAVDMVRQGTPAAIASFDKLGISTQFLQQNQNNLPAILQAISKSMSEGAVTTEKLAAVRTILGRAMAAKDIGELAESMDEYSGKMTAAAKTTQDLATIQKQFIKSANDIKVAFLEIIGPLAAFFAEFKSNSDRARYAAELLAAAIMGIVSVAVIKGFQTLYTQLQSIVTAFVANMTAAASYTTTVNAATLATAELAVANARLEYQQALTTANMYGTVAATRTLTGAKRQLAAAEAALATATEVTTGVMIVQAGIFTRFATFLGELIAGVKGATTAMAGLRAGAIALSEGAAAIGATIVAFITGVGELALGAAAVTAAIVGIGAAVGKAFGVDPVLYFTTQIKSLIDTVLPDLGKGLDWLNEKLGGKPATKPFTGDMSDQNSRRQESEAAAAKRAEDNAKFLNQSAAAVLGLRQQMDTMKLNNDLAAARVALELNLVGATNETKAAAERAFEFQSTKAKEVLRLQQEIAKMQTQAANEDAGAIKYGGQIAALQQQLKFVLNQKDAVGDLASQLAKAKDEQELNLFYLKESADVTKNVALIHQQIKELTMTTQQKMEAAYVKPMEEAIKKATDLEEKIKGSKLTETEIAAVTAKITAEYQRQIQAQKDLAVAQHSFGTGFQEAFNKFVDSATDAATVGKDVFNVMANSMTSAIDTFVTSGKFSFGDFARSVIMDLEKILLKAALVQTLQTGMSAMGISTASIGGLGASLGSLLGFGGGSAGTGGGGAISDAGIGGGGIVMAAGGGDVGYGQMAIVGEQGPELIRGPASVSNASQTASMMGGGGDTHFHNYNIQAVDAKSVAQLFYENRQTMFGMTEQARRELPMRVRS